MRVPHSLYTVATLFLVTATPLVAQDAQSRLWDASMTGDTTAIIQALADGAKVDSLDTRRSRNGRRALNWAALFNRVPALQLLLARGATVNAPNLTGFTPLHHAAEAGSLEAAHALLAAGADPLFPNNAGRKPIEVARDNGHLAVASLLETAEQEAAKTSP